VRCKKPLRSARRKKLQKKFAAEGPLKGLESDLRLPLLRGHRLPDGWQPTAQDLVTAQALIG